MENTHDRYSVRSRTLMEFAIEEADNAHTTLSLPSLSLYHHSLAIFISYVASVSLYSVSR